MTDDPDILDRIDDTLEQWDEWDGNSPDAARWAGEPTESEWPDRTDWYTYSQLSALEAMHAAGLELAWAVNESIDADRKQHRREVAWSVVAMLVGVALGVWLSIAVFL